MHSDQLTEVAILNQLNEWQQNREASLKGYEVAQRAIARLAIMASGQQQLDIGQ